MYPTSFKSHGQNVATPYKLQERREAGLVLIKWEANALARAINSNFILSAYIKMSKKMQKILNYIPRNPINLANKIPIKPIQDYSLKQIGHPSQKDLHAFLLSFYAFSLIK